MTKASWIRLLSRSFGQFKITLVGTCEADKGADRLLRRLWTEQRGVLTFEWVLLITLLVIGIVGGLSAARDALITELGDVAEAMISLDQSFVVWAPWEITTPACTEDGASESLYVDEAYKSEERSTYVGQEVTSCSDSGGG